MGLIKCFGEMWARSEPNLEDFGSRLKDQQGVYVLYDGSTPVYIGKGCIVDRIKAAHASERRANFWDHFSWYVINDLDLMHDVEVLLIRMLPPYLRFLNRQEGHFLGVHSTDQTDDEKNRTPKLLDRANI